MKTKTSASTISQIKKLRRQGHSIPEISRLCHISRSTALRYARDIKILPQFKQRWLDRRNAGKILSERDWQHATTKYQKLIHNLSIKEKLLIGAALYWAEGSKKDFNLINSDPTMITTFINILKTAFSVPSEKIKISIRIYEDMDTGTCLYYWSKITRIKLGKETSINILKGRKNGKLQYGMCRVRVARGGLLLKELFSIIKRISSLTSSPVIPNSS